VERSQHQREPQVLDVNTYYGDCKSHCIGRTRHRRNLLGSRPDRRLIGSVVQDRQGDPCATLNEARYTTALDKLIDQARQETDARSEPIFLPDSETADRRWQALSPTSSLCFRTAKNVGGINRCADPGLTSFATAPWLNSIS